MHRHQQILTRLPKEWRILFVEPPSIWPLLKNPRCLIPRKVSDNISVVSMPVAPFFERTGKLSKLNDLLIICWSRHLIKKLGFQKPIILFYEPRYSCVIGKLDESLTWYEIVDDRLYFKSVPEWIKTHIDNLISQSGLITTSSDFLFQKLHKLRKNNIYYVGNGVDSNHFGKALLNTKMPEDMVNIKKPILGYVGTVAEWFDTELVEKILTRFPDISVVIIGPVSPNQREAIRKLDTYQNFHFLGEKEYDVLPTYLKEFSVCIIPFKIYELTMAVNPLKWYEFCAAGKKTISTCLPALENYGDSVYIAKDHEDFLHKITLAMYEKADTQKLIAIAKNNDWDVKVNEFKNILNNYL